MPELTPEEKQKIYEEEKARKEAQEKLKKEEEKKQGEKTAKRCLGCLVIIGIIFAIVYIPSLFKSPNSSQIVNQTAVNPSTRSVQYIVTGSRSDYNVTYINESGGTEQKNNVKREWSYSFTGKPGGYAYVSAQNQTGTGTTEVKILVDGKVFKNSLSEGAYCIASASGSIP